jgi:putative NIF3 family GTP cyclohydrolase 1 type 2
MRHIALPCKRPPWGLFCDGRICGGGAIQAKITAYRLDRTTDLFLTREMRYHCAMQALLLSKVIFDYIILISIFLHHSLEKLLL